MRKCLIASCYFLSLLATGCSSKVRIDANGGEVRFHDGSKPNLIGTVLSIPPGTLTNSVDFEITDCDDLAIETELAAGPCVRLLPSTLEFSKPVSLTIPYRQNQVPPNSDLVLKSSFKSLVSTISVYDLDPDLNLAKFDIEHLGDYQALSMVSQPLPTRDVDILFLVDNSPSMSPKQKALASNISGFIQKLDAAGANYHIGIATSDIGSNVRPGVPWGGNIGKCDSYEGDDGVLQAIPCTDRITGGADARNDCRQLCPDDKFRPTDGRRFISKVDNVTNVPIAMERDSATGKMLDVGPIKSFRCMSLVGDDGCGIEGQLEAVKRALDGHRSENSGFLRANSLLAIVFLTDEDDCSVQMAKRDQNRPNYIDCAPDQPDSAECYNVDFRCLARSVQCNETMLTPGVKTNCRERPENYLESPSKYVSFLRAVRGSRRLLVTGIWTLPSVLSGGKLEIARAGGLTTANLNRAGGAAASCMYGKDQSVYGQAQLRLSMFASMLQSTHTATATESSVCDLDNYSTALDQLANNITAQLKK